MASKIFVNLPVKDLPRSIDFFARLGFTTHPQFNDGNAATMIINDGAAVMLLTESYFEKFAKKGIIDANLGTETIIALGVESRLRVDNLVETALANGATPANDTDDQDFMYSRSFTDLDGHLWEALWMDPEVMGG